MQDTEQVVFGSCEGSVFVVPDDVQKVFPSMLLAFGLLAEDVVFAGFAVSGQSWTSVSSSMGLGWIVGAESLRVTLFPLFLGGMLVPVKIFS
jgi:hypothetical protein